MTEGRGLPPSGACSVSGIGRGEAGDEVEGVVLSEEKAGAGGAGGSAQGPVSSDWSDGITPNWGDSVRLRGSTCVEYTELETEFCAA